MTSATAMDAAPASPVLRWPVLSRAFRLVVFALLAVGGLATMVQAHVIRGWESEVCAWAIGRLTSSSASADAARTTFSWDLFTPRAHGLIITPECTVAVMIGPLLISVAVVAAVRRLRPWRPLVGAAVGAALLTIVNFARLLIIAEAIHLFGDRAAFWWSHVVIGSLLSLAGFLGALAFAIRFSFADGRTGGPIRVGSPRRLDPSPTRKATP